MVTKWPELPVTGTRFAELLVEQDVEYGSELVCRVAEERRQVCVTIDAVCYLTIVHDQLLSLQDLEYLSRILRVKRGCDKGLLSDFDGGRGRIEDVFHPLLRLVEGLATVEHAENQMGGMKEQLPAIQPIGPAKIDFRPVRCIRRYHA